MKRLFLLTSVLACWTQSAIAADWLQFRGPNGNAIIAGADPQLQLDVDRVAWKIDLPGRGLSSPIVVGDRLFVTASSGVDQERLHVLCFRAGDGTQLWERQFWATGRTMSHPKTCVAANTPCSDGQRIFALYSSNDLICLDLDGNVLWLRGITRDYPNASNSLGMAASPMVVGKALVVPVENDSESFTLGLSVTTGVNLWKRDRPKIAAWTSPVAVPDVKSGKPLVALLASPGLSVVDPDTGDEVWYFPESSSSKVSATYANEVLFVPSKGITALAPAGPDMRPKVLWQNGQLTPGTASPVVIGDRIFTVNDAGVVTCGSTVDGERLWQLRTPGPVSASPVALGKHLYLVNEHGLVQVVSTTGEQGEIVGTFELGDTIIATPSIAAGGLLIRSDKSLWKLAGS